MQHPDKYSCNIRRKKTNETLRTGACNIRVQPLQHVQHPDYFCNIRMKHLQHTSKTFETSACNMQFQRKHLLAAWRVEARRHVEFARDSGPMVLVGSGFAVAAL